MLKPDVMQILEGSHIGLWQWNVQTGETLINERWATMLGYSLEELEPFSFEVFVPMVHPEDYPRLQESLQKHLAGETEYFTHRFRMRTRSGDWRWIKARGQVQSFDDKGEPAWMYGIHVDVSELMEKVELEALVNQSLDRILAASPAVIYEVSAQAPYQVEYVSPNVQKLMNVSSEELCKEGGWFKLVHAEDLDRAYHEFRLWMESPDQELVRRYRIRQTSGNYIWIEDVCRKRSEDGKLSSLVGSATDVTDQVSTEQRLQNVVDVVPGVIYQYELSPDGSSRFLYASNKLQDVYEVTPAQVREDASAVFAKIHPDDVEHVKSSISRSARQLNRWREDYRVVLADGQRWLHGDAIPSRSEDGTVTWNGMLMDISYQKNIEDELKESRLRLERAQKIARLGHWEANMQSGELFWSAIIYEIFGFDQATTQPSVELFSNCVHPDDLQLVRDSEKRAERTGIHDVEHRIIRPDGQVRWVHEVARRIIDEAGRDMMYGTVRDITRTKELELELRQLSTTDALTQAYNRRYFVEMAELVIERARRGQGVPLALLMFDLDHFKRVNDLYGHACGDDVLREVSVAVSGGLRKIDMLARLGGEEFVILLESCGQDEAVRIAESIRQRIGELTFYGGEAGQFQITASFGVAAWHVGESLQSLMSRADQAMYQAKRSGRNKVVLAG